MLGLSQADLARRAGVSTTGLNNIERGATDPKASTLTAIQKALETGVEFIAAGQLGVVMKSTPSNYVLKSNSAHPDEALARTRARNADEALLLLAADIAVGDKLEFCPTGDGEFRLEQSSGGFYDVEKSWDVRKVMRPK